MKKIIIAITGPSGAGKTTLGNLLIERDNFVTPVHSTTRNPRSDDKKGFYNYLSHEIFKQSADNNEFLFWSGDSNVINKNNGNFYGILNKDYEMVSCCDKIILFISYKDIEAIMNLKNYGYDIDIINLTYDDFDRTMIYRLNSEERDHSLQEINSRIEIAKEYEKTYSDVISSPSILRIPTDNIGIEETYNIVTRKLVR